MSGEARNARATRFSHARAHWRIARSTPRASYRYADGSIARPDEHKPPTCPNSLQEDCLRGPLCTATSKACLTADQHGKEANARASAWMQRASKREGCESSRSPALCSEDSATVENTMPRRHGKIHRRPPCCPRGPMEPDCECLPVTCPPTSPSAAWTGYQRSLGGVADLSGALRYLKGRAQRKVGSAFTGGV